MLVKHNETNDNINEAAKVLQDVQVETYGSMDYREKLEFILYQMKIMIKKQDWIRLIIVSRKINSKYLEVEDQEDLTVIYYSYLYIYYKREKEFLNASNALKTIYDNLKSNKERIQKMDKIIDFGFE